LEQSRKQDKRNLFFLSVWKMQEEVKRLKASLNKYAPKGYEAISTGTKPISKINPVVVQAMDEVGVDVK
jgi:arsenate reductase (thioredoxin)